MSLQITTPMSTVQFGQTRELLKSLVAWLKERHSTEPQVIDAWIPQDEALPGEYGPPEGRLLLATVSGEPAGCAALRNLGRGACEMRRLFVAPKFREAGVGQALVEAVTKEAREAGYRTLLTEATFRLREAHQLYEKLEFKPVRTWYEPPPEVKDWLVFYGLPLTSAS